MAKRVFRAQLSSKSIDGLIKQLEDYKQSLKEKNDVFVRRLAEVGIPVIDRGINGAVGASDKSHRTYVTIRASGDYSQATLTVEGEQILFIEFGAGIHYNGAAGTSPHPLGGQFGYTIGSYGKGQGKNDSWVYYESADRWKRTHGTKAAMPVYNASKEITSKVLEIAKEVFGT